MTTEARRTLARRALAAWGPAKQRLACAGECAELSAEIIRDSLGRHDEQALAEELAGVLQTIESVRLTLDPEILAAAELAQADKLEAKLELAEAEGDPADYDLCNEHEEAFLRGTSCPECEPAVTDTAPVMARILWDNLPPPQQEALRRAAPNSSGGRDVSWGVRPDSARALARAGYIELETRLVTPVGLAVRAAGMGR